MAKVRQALPTDALLWTARRQLGEGQGGGVPASMATASDGSSDFEYRMVLQLTDTNDPNATFGALLLGQHANTFFPGVPPADLTVGNVSVQQLRKRITAICDAPSVELGLWACRPQPGSGDGAGARSVAYHIVGTTLVWKP